MGRKKRVPHRAVGIQRRNEGVVDEAKVCKQAGGGEELNSGEKDGYIVQVGKGSWGLDNHYDVSEIVLTNLRVNAEFLLDSKYLLRFRLNNVGDFVNRIKLGHWPVLSASSIELQFVEGDVVMAFGNFDGPDEAVSGLVHLVSLGFLTLRPVVLGTGVLREDTQSLRMRVEVLESAFNACNSLLDNTRQLWKKSMMNVMAWLRPEVMTSEARYGGYKTATCKVIDSSTMAEEDDRPAVDKRARFDLGGFYEAIKPSKENPMLEDDLPGLLPELRPYQRRAAYWMIKREKGNSERGSEKNSFSYPLCMAMSLIDSSSRLYYNPFCGNISLHPEYSYSYVPGGILADEMGLGKTVELLACIFANRASSEEVTGLLDKGNQEDGSGRSNLRRLKRERVECVCGAVSESLRYKGLWVQCDKCDAWQHADCVGFSPKGRKAESRTDQKHVNRRKDNDITLMDGAYICQMCSELIQATESPVATAATLIVCPSPILSQWQSEIVRHTRPGSLRVLVYEGLKSSSISDAPPIFDVSNLISADVVLTTYDVLKEDLSHDFDRHEGDRRTMRFEKRYPVIPTPLTRIFWWRICLDEAQMVESNAAASTEMALRLNAKHHWCITGTPIQKKLDDLYGLLKFIRACPFDVFRWWTEVIRTPYQEGDGGAMTFAHNFLKTIIWRTSKAHVAEELQIPPQEEGVSWLSLSPIEAHFYRRQHETCVKDAHEVVESMKEDILKRNKSGCSKAPDVVLSEHLITHLEAAKLFKSLLKLRQACCHPQVGSSGLRALQHSPMTMQEILSALVGKTKIEGEEALRKLVSAINGLAGIAILKQEYSLAVSLYKEALAIAEENSEDFRLDPLLNIHIHHNLAELLLSSDCTGKFPDDPRNSTEEDSKAHELKEENDRPVKRARLSGDAPNLIIESDKMPEDACKSQTDNSCKPTHAQNYSAACEHSKERFLSAFYSKLSMAQQEFKKTHEQLSYEFSCRKNLHSAWWMEALLQIEQNKDSSSELIKKIIEAIAGTLNTSRMSRVSSCFRSITTIKYFIQTGLDSLEESRKRLLDRLVDIDCTMENPREVDVTRVRSCPICCQGDGVLCVHCELDDLFQAYEARLFRLSKGSNGDSLTSAEEAVNFQKRRFALNRFYQTLSKDGKKATLADPNYEDDEKKRDVKDKVTVSKSPSDLEVVLGIIKNNSKGLLDGEGVSGSTKQLLLLEGMRKEYVLARSLARAQAQVMRAYDEINMATSRLRLKEEVNDDSVDALSPDELDAASIQNSSDKFLAVSLLSRIKGQLRYLKGLASSEQNLQSDDPNKPVLTESEIPSSSSPAENEQKGQTKAHEEACPVCREKLTTQKMVFQCGHVTCCKCLIAMTERKFGHHGNNWIMCPTCRQHTDFGSIAFADDRRNSSYSSSSLADEKAELSIRVQGSYSTKIEAVVRRILSITSTDPAAKVLVFSSWNDVLDVLEHAFVSNMISFVRMKGGRKSNVAINCFKGKNADGKSQNGTQSAEPGFVQVMLILFQHGANGLNLLEAKHVILVEPLLNPAVEAQAIGRVHRIGQENRTFVHRFIVKDTVEESIYKLNRSRNTTNTSALVSGNRKNHDYPVLTLKDVESLFRVASSSSGTTGTTTEEEEQKTTESLNHLPPSVAAAIAAERRLAEGNNNV